MNEQAFSKSFEPVFNNSRSESIQLAIPDNPGLLIILLLNKYTFICEKHFDVSRSSNITFYNFDLVS